MNKLQIKAEILATLRALSSSSMPEPSLLTDLKNIEDKKTVFDILIKELSNAEEQKSLLEEQMTSTDYEVVKKAGEQYTLIEKQLAEKYTRWEYLAELGN